MMFSMGRRASGASTLLVCGLLLLAGPLSAQETGPANPPHQADARPADAARLALAERLFGMMHLDVAMRGMLANVVRSAPGFNQADPRTQRLLASFSKGLDTSMPQLTHEVAAIYARTLSIQELTDALAFYGTPSGQAILTKMPVIMRQAMPLTVRLIPRIAADAEQDFCGQETCSPVERDMFARLKGMGSGPDGGRP